MSFNYSFDSSLFDGSFPVQEFSRVLAIVLISAAAIGLIVGLVFYIINALAVQHIARRRDIKAPWLAWIPLARNWTMGAIADEYDRRSVGHDRRFRIFYLVLSALYIIISFTFLASIGAAASTIVFEDVIGNSEELLKSTLAMISAISGFSSYGTYAFFLLLCLESIIVFKIYDSLNPRLALIFTLLFVVVPIFGPISMFCMRKRGYPEAIESPAIPEAVRIGWYDQD